MPLGDHSNLSIYGVIQDYAHFILAELENCVELSKTPFQIRTRRLQK